MLGYLDCRMMVLGTKMYVAKEKLGANLRYGSYLAAVKTDKFVKKVKSNEIVGKVKNNLQETVDKLKSKKAEKAETKEETVETVNKEKVVVNTEYEVVNEPVKTEVVSEVKEDTTDNKTEDTQEAKAESVNTNDIRVEEVNGMDFSSAIEKEPVSNGPDFSLLRGVTYDPITNDLVVNNESETKEENKVPEFKVVGTDPETGKPLYEVTPEDLEIALAKEKERLAKESKKNR